MKKTLLTAVIAAAALLYAPCADAVPARPGVTTRTMADGSTVKVRLMGDEFHHYLLSEDGYALVERDGLLYYGNVDFSGKLVSSNIKATDVAKRSTETVSYLSKINKEEVGTAIDAARAQSPRLRSMELSNRMRAQRRAATSSADEGYPMGPGLFPGASFPVKGDQKALVILVQYKDKKFNLSDPKSYFSRMLNETGFNDYGGTGCAKEYFEECSGGLFRPQFDVLGPITLSKSMNYYGGNDSWGNDQHPEEMVIEACQQLDATVDFKQYDRNGDGYIDNVFVFYAGQGEASYGSESTVWPHSWEITSATSIPYIFDGVRLDRYGCTNEWEQSRPDGVGTFIHEFSHVMGLPDLYTTSYNSSAFTPGEWSVLDYGPYNNDGMTPPLYGAFERYALGWNAPAVVDRAMNATLPAVGSNITGIIPTSDSNEFFLLENRQQTGWDTYLPGHGMLIWHVQYNASKWTDNIVNDSSSHQYVDIEEADNTKTDTSRAGDAYPGTKNVTSFTSSTTPAMKTWAGKAIDMPLTEIAESADGIITFKVKGGHTPLYDAIVANEATCVWDRSFIASWVATDADYYCLNVYTTDAQGKRNYLDGYEGRNVGNATSVVVDNLEPGTQYYYTVYGVYRLEYTPVSAEIAVTTLAPGINRYAVEALEATEIGTDKFTATWNHLDGATDYMLTVYCRDTESSFYTTTDFTDGVDKLPDGFSSSSKSSYTVANYCGQAAPSLRLAADGDNLTATLDDDIRSLTFWHRGNATTADDVINIYAINGSTRRLVTTLPIVTDMGGKVTEITDIPAYTESVVIEFSRKSTSGALAIDDVKVGFGYTNEDVVLPEYNNLATGYTNSHNVTGLEAGKTYSYVVTATDGSLESLPSQKITLTTLTDGNHSGIDSVDAENMISLNGRALTVTAQGLITVATIDGRVVASANRNLDITLPSQGIYIVVADREARKVIVR